MTITSNATWTKIDQTKDVHHTEDQAKAVCERLERYDKHRPCGLRGECLEAWVEVNGVRV